VYARYDRAGHSGWPVWLASLVWRIRGCWNYRESRQRCLPHGAHEAYGAACRRTAAWESMVTRQHRSMAACTVTGSITVVQHCRSAARQDGSIAAWQDGSTASRHHGRHHGSMGTLQHGSTPALQLQCSMPHSLSSAACKRKAARAWGDSAARPDHGQPASRGPSWGYATCALPVAPCQGDPLTHTCAVSCPPGPAPMMGPIPTSHRSQVNLRRSRRFFL
jgi:hypothetical protein